MRLETEGRSRVGLRQGEETTDIKTRPEERQDNEGNEKQTGTERQEENSPRKETGETGREMRMSREGAAAGFLRAPQHSRGSAHRRVSTLLFTVSLVELSEVRSAILPLRHTRAQQPSPLRTPWRSPGELEVQVNTPIWCRNFPGFSRTR